MRIKTLLFVLSILLLNNLNAQLNDYNPSDIQILDNCTNASSDLNLIGAHEDAIITEVDLYFEIQHTRHGDLMIWLTTYYNNSWNDYIVYNQGDLNTSGLLSVSEYNLHIWDGASANQEWFLVARDCATGETGYIDFFELWVTYETNNPPNVPYNEDPDNGEQNVNISHDLDWSCTDPDGDNLDYYVYFGTDSGPDNGEYQGVATGSSYDLGTLNYATHYYWKVIAFDSDGLETSSPVWDFYTEEAPLIDAEITNVTFNDTEIIVGQEEITVTITIQNIGNQQWTFWIGSSSIEENDTEWYAWLPPRTSVNLNPNQSESVQLSWSPQIGDPIGTYGFYSKIFKYSTGDDWFDDYWQENAFQVTEVPFPINEGKIVFHSYSDYDAWDGKLFICDFSQNLLTEISQDWDIDHTINAHFSPDGSTIVFMGVPEGHHNSNSWDIYFWELFSGEPTNLTNANNIRDEDPKFSPNGSEIIFKQNGDLKVMDLNGNIIIHTTNDGYSIEESMPYYQFDNQNIIYAKGAGSSSDIYLINKDGSNNRPVENVASIQEYYPITRSNSTFLYTRWVSASNHHDQIYLGYFSGENTISLPFNDVNADDSDPFPVNSDYVLFSSNRTDGQGGWDLFLSDINSGSIWSMDEFNINTSIHELGVCYFSGESIIGPIADFSGSPTNGTVPLTVTYTDLSDEGSSSITNWNWDFGDGSNSTSSNPIHTYTDAGTFPVTLTVTTSVGSDSETRSNYISASSLNIFDELSQMPLEYSLYQNFPNPFNPTTAISFSIPAFGLTTITAYDINGRQLEILTNEVLSVGNYSINWNATSYPSGVYLIRMESNEFTQTQKVVLVK